MCLCSRTSQDSLKRFCKTVQESCHFLEVLYIGYILPVMVKYNVYTCITVCNLKLNLFISVWLWSTFSQLIQIILESAFCNQPVLVSYEEFDDCCDLKLKLLTNPPNYTSIIIITKKKLNNKIWSLWNILEQMSLAKEKEKSLNINQ